MSEAETRPDYISRGRFEEWSWPQMEIEKTIFGEIKKQWRKPREG